MECQPHSAILYAQNLRSRFVQNSSYIRIQRESGPFNIVDAPLERSPGFPPRPFPFSPSCSFFIAPSMETIKNEHNHLFWTDWHVDFRSYFDYVPLVITSGECYTNGKDIPGDRKQTKLF